MKSHEIILHEINFSVIRKSSPLYKFYHFFLHLLFMLHNLSSWGEFIIEVDAKTKFLIIQRRCWVLLFTNKNHDFPTVCTSTVVLDAKNIMLIHNWVDFSYYSFCDNERLVSFVSNISLFHWFQWLQSIFKTKKL